MYFQVLEKSMLQITDIFAYSAIFREKINKMDKTESNILNAELDSFVRAEKNLTLKGATSHVLGPTSSYTCIWIDV